MKENFLTPKAISNRMKAKCRLKLKFYCPPCRKQCRDDNGFKCHCMSEGHIRQMQLLGHDLQGYVKDSSQAFMEAFLDALKQHGRTKVLANSVYNDYIGDRHSIHMKATRWATLTEFVSFLGTTGKCRVDITEKGPFLTYNDGHEVSTNPKLRQDVTEENRREREVQMQIQRALAVAKASSAVLDHDGVAPAPLGPAAVNNCVDRTQGDKRIRFSLACHCKSSLFKGLGHFDNKIWLCEGIVVKVVSRRFAAGGNCLYKKKGLLRKVTAPSVGEVVMIETGDVLEADQEELETVVPQIGGAVRIVAGAYCGCVAVLLSIDVAAFKAQVQITEGKHKGKVLDALNYEDICKLASPI